MSLLDDIRVDLADFLDSTEFGKFATYTPQGGSGVGINIIFDAPYEEVSPLTGGIELTNPVAYARASDMPNVKQKDTLLVDSATYKIIGIQPDGTGLLKLELSKD